MPEDFDWVKTLQDMMPVFVENTKIDTRVNSDLSNMMGSYASVYSYISTTTTIYMNCIVDPLDLQKIFGPTFNYVTLNTTYIEALNHALPECIKPFMRRYECSANPITYNYRITYQIVVGDLETFKRALWEETWGTYSKEFDKDMEETWANKVE